MRKISKILLGAVVLLFIQEAIAQEQQPKPKFEFKPYGFIAYDLFVDTYKSVDSKDGESYLYPLSPDFDKNGKDYNKRTMLEMTNFTSRLGLKIAGPDIFGAKSNGQFEMDFMGTKQDYIQLFTLRHAFINLKWEKSELIIGQTWHPIIANEVAPSTVSFGAGVPFHPLNRSAQIKYTYHISPLFRLTAATAFYGGHKPSGPAVAQRYSGKPDVHFQLSVGNRKEFLAGFSAGYKWLTPRLKTDSSYVTSKTIGSYDVNAFIMFKPASTSIKAEVVYGQNLSYISMIGGYGMKTGSNNEQGDFDYTNLKTVSVWCDIQQEISNWTIAVFTGYQKLLGADDKYTTIKDYNRDDNLSNIIRVSPRVVYKVDAFSLGLEYILTKAVYGSAWDSNHKVKETLDPVSNNRVLLRVAYTF
ncbi:MAG TPA: hypothetical protein DIW31_07575 [Bacteroidales bacterium]|nr:hypothetical protein [Bacteroidales bacterium]